MFDCHSNPIFKQGWSLLKWSSNDTGPWDHIMSDFSTLDVSKSVIGDLHPHIKVDLLTMSQC
jgi:hypothetical protein